MLVLFKPLKWYLSWYTLRLRGRTPPPPPLGGVNTSSSIKIRRPGDKRRVRLGCRTAEISECWIVYPRRALPTGILYIRRVVLCVRDSAQTASHICTYMYLVPINCTIITDVQHTFNFDLDLTTDPGQGHKNLVIFCMLYLQRVPLYPNRFTETMEPFSMVLINSAMAAKSLNTQ